MAWHSGENSAGNSLYDRVMAGQNRFDVHPLTRRTQEREVALLGHHRDLLTGAETKGTVRLGQQDALTLIKRAT